MGNRGCQLPHRREAINVRELRLRLTQCFRGLHQLVGPFCDTLFKLLIESLDFGLGSLEGGAFDNVPTSVSPCEDKLVCTHHIQDLRSSAPRKRVRAQHGEALIAYDLVETIFIGAKVSPVLVCLPGRIPGHSHAGVTSGRDASEFLIPGSCQSLAIKRATLEKP